jgi:hypothetical protein
MPWEEIKLGHTVASTVEEVRRVGRSLGTSSLGLGSWFSGFAPAAPLWGGVVVVSIKITSLLLSFTSSADEERSDRTSKFWPGRMQVQETQTRQRERLWLWTVLNSRSGWHATALKPGKSERPCRGGAGGEENWQMFFAQFSSNLLNTSSAKIER